MRPKLEFGSRQANTARTPRLHLGGRKLRSVSARPPAPFRNQRNCSYLAGRRPRGRRRSGLGRGHWVRECREKCAHLAAFSFSVKTLLTAFIQVPLVATERFA
jgi:hypothetical protein